MYAYSKRMNKYENGKIYTIRCKTDDSSSLIYVGSTTQPLCKRFSNHKIASKKYPNSKLYSKINGDWDNWYIELYEECCCKNKEQLNKREGQIIREISTLNSYISGRTHHEYYLDNKEHKKKYYRDNCELKKEYQRNYYQRKKGVIDIQS